MRYFISAVFWGRFLLFFFILFASTRTAVAQDTTKDSLYIYRAGRVVGYAVTQVDSIVFTNPGFAPSQESVSSAAHAVDLGLSVKWADLNVGASTASDYGWLTLWGDASGEVFKTDVSFSSYPMVISSDMRYDVAQAQWGGRWRMPLLAEWQELINRCTWVITQRDGVLCYCVTGPNGNSIYLPAAGYRSGSSKYKIGVDGHYWSGDKQLTKTSNKLSMYLQLIGLTFNPSSDSESGYSFSTGTLDSSQGCSVRHVYGTLPTENQPPEKVDLGLSVKWASMNVGAQSAEDYGGYFQWGVTYKGDVRDNYALVDSTGSYKTYHRADGRKTTIYMDLPPTISGTQFDVANVLWSDGWRMPTLEEFTELATKCTWVAVTQNGVRGYKVIGPNGNDIFLPATGYYSNGTFYDDGTSGFYWTASWEEKRKILDDYIQTTSTTYLNPNPFVARYIGFNTAGIPPINPVALWQCSRCVRAVCP